MMRKHASFVPGGCCGFLLRLALMVSLLSRAACVVTIRNWTAYTTIMVTPIPDGSTDDLEPNDFMQYTCTGNGRNGMFTVANRKDENVVTFFLNDGENLALVDNVNDSIDVADLLRL